MELIVEVAGMGPSATLPGGGGALVAFMSFAVSRGFGAQHPLVALADRLHDDFGVRMGPLTTFYEGQIDDAEDAAKLELAWQPAQPLTDALDGITTALATDALAQALVRRGGAEALAAEAKTLAEITREAAGRAALVRLSYAL